MLPSSSFDIVIIGLTITSSWGNGHATTYRGLVRELEARGHSVLFLERDVPWYAPHRDPPEVFEGSVQLYGSVRELRSRFGAVVKNARLVMVGSFVPDGVEIGEWVQSNATGICAFYDIDTPVTLGKLARKEFDYITPEQVSGYDLYLSFAGGPILDLLQRVYGAVMSRALYCSVDPLKYYPQDTEKSYDLGYMGTYSVDRQQVLDKLMLKSAEKWPQGRFIVAGPQYPDDIEWPPNVCRKEHIPPGEHAAFYCSQRFTLNVTRADMVASGYAPSVRLFEAGACGVAVISDYWDGLNRFFEIGSEIIVSRSWEETLRVLSDMAEDEIAAMGQRARRRVLVEHTAAHRAEELDHYVSEAIKVKARKVRNRIYVSRHV